MKYKKIPIPSFDSEYIKIYTPSRSVYKGIDTENFKNGEIYDEWITNDFSVLRDGDTWHIVGITHPKPPEFKNDFEYGDDVHEAEFQLFHAVAQGKSFADVFRKEKFNDEDKILYPSDRPGERPELWAPHLMKMDGRFNVVYSPEVMRRASSVDFKEWKKEPDLFVCTNGGARDPYIYEENGRYYTIYTQEKKIRYRESVDMLNWSEEKIIHDTIFPDCEPESPFMLKRDGIYYLFWSASDGRNGCYDYRTFVFASETIDGFGKSAPITMLNAHAPEFVCDANGDWYMLSVFYPENGISAVKIKWV